MARTRVKRITYTPTFEQNIAIPDRRYGFSIWDALDQMEVNDSFQCDSGHIAGSARTAGKNKGYTMSVRKLNATTWRVWRTA